MKKVNKYLYLFIVQGYYGSLYEWEDLTASESYREARQDLRDYSDNEWMYSHRIINRRIPNSDYND